MKYVSAMVSVLLLAGCVTWEGARTPNLWESENEEELAPPPVIKLVFSHEHMMEGDSDAPFTGGGMSESQFRKALERVSNESPLMSRASFMPREDVHYILFLDTYVNEHGQGLAILSGLSFMLFPVIPSSDVGVSGVLYEASSGELVNAYEAEGKLKVLIWLPLLPITPFALAFGPGQDLYDRPYKDLFILVSSDLKNRPLPEPADPNELVIEEEVKYKERTIRKQ